MSRHKRANKEATVTTAASLMYYSSSDSVSFFFLVINFVIIAMAHEAYTAYIIFLAMSAVIEITCVSAKMNTIKQTILKAKQIHFIIVAANFIFSSLYKWVYGVRILSVDTRPFRILIK